MTTTPDKQTVRDLARKFLLDDGLTADELDYIVYGHTGYGVGHEEFQAWRDAIDADVQEATVAKTVSWPDEQPQDERNPCGVQLPADSAQRLGASPDTRCARPDGHAAHDDGNGVVWVDRERAAQPERDGDTRAIDAMIMASVRGDSGAMALAFDNLRKRWIGRIAELDARKAKGGGQ